MATQADLDRAYAWAKAQVGKPYVLGTFGNTFDCSTYMSGIATMIRDGVAKQWFTTHPFHSGAKEPLPGWVRDLEAPFMIGITADGIGHTGGTLLGTEFEATAAGNRVVRMGDAARGARDPYYDYVYGFRPSILETSNTGGQVTASSLRAMASGGTQISNGKYNEGSTSGVAVMLKSGVVHYTSGMSIDCDGQPGSACNINTDPYFQPNTSWNQSDGKPLKAEQLPFIVVPLPSNVWNYSDAGIVGGNLCTIVYKDRYVHAVVGDQGPSGRIGEASYAAAEALGIPSSPTSGGVGSGVTYIVYPGVRVSPIESASEARRLGEIQAAKWLGATTPASPATYTLDTDDTLTGVADHFGVNVDALASINNLIKVGQELQVTDPSETWVTVHHAELGDTWTLIAEKYGITVDELLDLNGIKVAVGSSYIVKKEEPEPAPVSGKISPTEVMFNRTTSETGKTFTESVVRNTLQLMGLPVTDAWVNGYTTMALRESSYNPNAINTYDSNAINPPGYSNASDGHPFQCSRGMWQCIPQTFAAHHQAGTSLSIYDPIASCAASINYVRSRYDVAYDGSNLAQKVQQADPSRPPKGY